MVRSTWEGGRSQPEHRGLLRGPVTRLPRKEVIQPQLPLRLPCYDFVPVTRPAFGRWLLAVTARTSGVAGSHDVTGGVYKAREQIHRRMADRRLLATPPSRGRVAAPDPNWGRVCGIGSPSRVGNPLSRPLERACRPGRKGHADLTSSPPSSGLLPAVRPEKSNWPRGLRSLRDLTQHLTARADDSRAPPRTVPRRETGFHRLSLHVQAQVRFFASHRIKPHAPLLVRAPVNSFEF